MIKYKAQFTQIGPLVSEFLAHNILVLFGSTAPDELREFAVIHDGENLIEPIAVGDTVSFNDESFKVLAVGEVANTNLKNLGHLVLKCNGQTEPEMPGDVCLDDKPLPLIEVGTILIVSN